MTMKEINKLAKYWKIQEKIDKLIYQKNEKCDNLPKINEAINKLKEKQRKYE